MNYAVTDGPAIALHENKLAEQFLSKHNLIWKHNQATLLVMSVELHFYELRENGMVDWWCNG